MKIIGMILIIIASSGIGILLAKGLKIKLDVISDFIKVFTHIKLNMKYTNSNIMVLLDDATKKIDSNNLVYKLLVQHIKDKEHRISLDNIIAEIEAERRIGSNDKSTITGCINSLGSTDLIGQEQLLEHTVLQLQNSYETLSGEYKKSGKLYTSLGVFAGIAISIFFI